MLHNWLYNLSVDVLPPTDKLYNQLYNKVCNLYVSGATRRRLQKFVSGLVIGSLLTDNYQFTDQGETDGMVQRTCHLAMELRPTWLVVQ